MMSAAQLGVPLAAATIGQETHLLGPGEPAALILGALVTVVGLAIASRLAAGSKLVATAPALNASPTEN
jgi:hypothetical protein